MDIQTASIEQLLIRANEIRRGAHETPEIAFKIAERLAGQQYMEYARRLAHHIHLDDRLNPKTACKVLQKYALWTSKNPDQPDDSKHDEALKILDRIKNLDQGESLATTTNQETLGIAGGICKRKWLVDGQVQTLKQSLAYYDRGVAQGIAKDNGYTAINAAFVRDLLASLESSEKDQELEHAEKIRREILELLIPLENEPAWPGGPRRKDVRWFHETIAEAHFGLGEYPQATERLQAAYSQAMGTPEPWELETTARQFAWLARLQDPVAITVADFKTSPPWQAIQESFDAATVAGAESLFAGKLGLALSGGGFRASFFHIGILAALAEMDMLRHVEALSCVSGGSILGAHYYLEIRQRLQEKSDQEMTRDDYIEIVTRIAEQFLQGVQQNIRVRVAESLVENLRMMFIPGYTQTNRLGELYEEHLFSRVPDQNEQGKQERILRNLKVKPKGTTNFKPKYDNWKRRNKVPILILNATSLNTGHNWQFTATWMGEPPSAIDSQVDGNYRLRRMWYDEAPTEHQDIRLGQAVAASSCVPGLFTPLELSDLYQDITVRLVDGGVHDNQGVFGLLDQNCTVFVVSDASGQMAADNMPKDNILPVLIRSSSVSMARVRTAEFRELESRKKSGRLKGLAFLHLKKELHGEDIDWLGCDNPKELSPEELKQAKQKLTSYNILKSLQDKIANIRTDLDSFSDTEAFALMSSGYSMARNELADRLEGFEIDPRERDWDFLKISPELRKASGPKWLTKSLEVAKTRAFKIWQLSPLLKALSALLAMIALCALGWFAWSWRAAAFLSVKGLIAAFCWTALTVLIGAIGLGFLVKIIEYRKTINQILLGAGLCLVGTVAAKVHLKIFDPWFKKFGRFPR